MEEENREIKTELKEENHEMEIGMKEENHEMKIGMKEENHEMKIGVKEENHEMEIGVKEENHEVKQENHELNIEVEEENHEIKTEMKEENHEVNIEVEDKNHEMKTEMKEENHEEKQEENHEINIEEEEENQEEYQDQEEDHHDLNTTNQTQPATPSGLQMTIQKSTSNCPICRKPLAAMTQHLRRVHHIRNSEERSILLKIAAGRINIRAERCPMSGCSYDGPRCDKHLRMAHPELSAEEGKLQSDMLKERVGMRLLRELRATNPSPPLSSTLDLGPECEEGADLGPPVIPPSFDCAGCSKWYREARKANEELSKLRASCRLLHRRYLRLRKKCRKTIITTAESEEEDDSASSYVGC